MPNYLELKEQHFGMKMRPEQSDAMFRLAGVRRESLHDALHKLRENPYYARELGVRDSSAVASVIVSCLLHCYAPDQMQGSQLIYLITPDGGPRGFIAYPKQRIVQFDSHVHIEQVYEGESYAIIDLLANAGEDLCCYDRGQVIHDFSGYWPPKMVQFLAQSLGYDYENPVRHSRGWTPSPEVAAECEPAEAGDVAQLG